MRRFVLRSRYTEPLVMLITLMRWITLASITGLVVGCGTSIFLRGLFYSIGKTAALPRWAYLVLLPAGGLINGLLLYYGYGKGKRKGSDSVIAAVHEREGNLPFATAPLKPIAAIVTLACGGSAGKEGPCSHIGGTLASLVARCLRLKPEVKRRLVICGISAGFASVFGTPLAGTIYGIEVLAIGQLRHDILFQSFIAGITSFEVSRSFHIPYTYFPFRQVVPFSELLLVKIILLGVGCGFASWLFIEMYEQWRDFFRWLTRRFRLWAPIVPFIGGLVLAVLILFLPTQYLGLSLPLMNHAMTGAQIPYLAFFWKILFVAITLGSGFYGGIVTPQFVIGATAGNVFAHLLHIDPVLGAAAGMVAAVAAASNTPIAAIVMGFELFGANTGIYVVAACATAYVIVGHRSVYPDQRVRYQKSLWMHLQPGVALDKEEIHVSYSFLRGVHKLYPHPSNSHHHHAS